MKRELEINGETIYGAPICEVKRGEFVKLTPNGKKIYRHGGYDGTVRKYILQDVEDINSYRTFKRDKEVFYEFEY